MTSHCSVVMDALGTEMHSGQADPSFLLFGRRIAFAGLAAINCMRIAKSREPVSMHFTA